MTGRGAVRSLRDNEIEVAADLLARVFQDDPLMVFLNADKGSTRDRPMSFYTSNLRLGLRDGRVDVLDDLTGVAIWLRPGKTSINAVQVVRSGMLWATLGMGLQTMRRFIAIDRAVRPMTKEVVPESYWLLLFLAVDASRQGQGLGGDLIQPVLDHADTNGQSCYLDSSNNRNLSFYQRHDFTIAGDVQVSEGPHIWGMIRHPVTGEH